MLWVLLLFITITYFEPAVNLRVDIENSTQAALAAPCSNVFALNVPVLKIAPIGLWFASAAYIQTVPVPGVAPIFLNKFNLNLETQKSIFNPDEPTVNDCALQIVLLAK
jgi:hypothetical protein